MNGHRQFEPSKSAKSGLNKCPRPGRRLYLSNKKKNAATSTANQTNVSTMKTVSRRIP